MNDLTKLKKIKKAAETGEFLSFVYIKEDGTKKQRTVRFGGDIPKRLEKQGTPINGRGSWMTGFSEGKNGFLVEKEGEIYVRGTEVGANSGHKIYKLAGIEFSK